MDSWWLHLFTEFAFFSKWTGTLNPKTIADSLPLKTQKMVVETLGEAAIEPREMLKTENAIFYISFSYGDDPATGGIANYSAVVRKAMDGNQDTCASKLGVGPSNREPKMRLKFTNFIILETY